ncbi:MAG: PPC domain-containing protein [Chloroflexi bacterium]|nr:PPC domain-containing protein [Chloroflexota bacterium]
MKNTAIAGLCWLICWLSLPALAQVSPSLSIRPAAGEVEKAVFLIEIDGLEAQATYRIEIHFAGATVFAAEKVSDAAGHISFPISSTAGDQPGVYRVRALHNDIVVAQGEFELTAPAQQSAGAQVTVTPQRAIFGRPQAIHIGDLLPKATYTIEVITDDTGQLAYRRAHKSSQAGDIDFEIFAQAGDTPGAHSIAVYDEAGSLVAQGDFTIEMPLARDVRLELSPRSVQAGDSVVLQIDGLAAFDAVSAQLLSAQGVLIDALSTRASSDGAASLLIATPADIVDGAYTIALYVDGNAVVNASLLVGTAPTAETPTTPATAEQPASSEPADDATMTIAPLSAPIGSSHRVTVSGVSAEESLGFEISLAGEVVFSTTQRADASGRATLELLTDAEDQPGEYSIKLLRKAGKQPTVSFVVTAAERSETAQTPRTTRSSVQVIESRLQSGAAQVSFQGAAGRTVEIRVESDEFDPAAALIGRDEAQITASDDSRGSKNAILGPLVLPYSGSFRLEVAGAPLMMAQGAETGDFRVEIEELRPVPLRSGEASFALTSESPRLHYRLSLSAGDTLSISIDSGGSLDSLLQLVAPDGGEIAFDDDSGGGLDAELSNLAIEQSGDYILVVASYDERAGGGVLRLERNPVRQLDEIAAAVTLNDKSIRERFVFDAAADELLILNIVKINGDVADLVVHASVEGMEVMSHSTMGVPDALPLPFVMPMSGQVLLTLEKVGVDDGITLDVSLRRP